VAVVEVAEVGVEVSGGGAGGGEGEHWGGHGRGEAARLHGTVVEDRLELEACGALERSVDSLLRLAERARHHLDRLGRQLEDGACAATAGGRY
jgi:hypothetical protein